MNRTKIGTDGVAYAEKMATLILREAYGAGHDTAIEARLQADLGALAVLQAEYGDDSPEARALVRYYTLVQEAVSR